MRLFDHQLVHQQRGVPTSRDYQYYHNLSQIPVYIIDMKM